MRPNSRRMIGNVRSFVGNSLGGLRGWNNLASWAVASTLAYFLWVKPSRELKAEQVRIFYLSNFRFLDFRLDFYGSL
ncbi:hypothetical protein KSP39_PZI019173 [Platanthera zijinensis]|uniref:Uncharacterized protein n=1 Tax=Platanthera zijinensis TaxID=2320716 RepID=A0AAP0B211_9ASPA